MGSPIITSRLDNDFYNFTMGQLIWRHFREVQVTYRLTNRTKSVRLGKLITPAQVIEEVESLRSLSFRDAELDFLAGLGLFDQNYLDWLAMSRLPDVNVTRLGYDLEVSYSGDWASSVFWESPLLAIVNQLANQARSQGGDEPILAAATQRLTTKTARLAAQPRIKLVEFGLRRRFSTAWQRQVVEHLSKTLPSQLLGTSNAWLAYELGLEPKGTMAHQLFMVTTALARSAGSLRPIADSQQLVLDLYEQEYGQVADKRMLVFLPDTYGTDTALRLLDPQQAARWAGMRQDSGDPIVQVQKMIDYYRAVGVNPATKTIMPSDSLDVDLMSRLDEAYGDQTRLVFGVGTSLTNDTPLPPISIVIKPTHANGAPCGKLTDNIHKAWGNEDIIALLARESGYHTAYAAQPTS